MTVNTVTIKNFRGIKSLENIELKSLSILLGDNGTCKTTILEAINYALSPSYLSGRIKHTDFYNGTGDPIEIHLTFVEDFHVNLPDGYTTQAVNCKQVCLKIKKRDRAATGKAFSDTVVVEHYVLPTQPRTSQQGWEITRSSGTIFRFNERLLSFPVDSDDLPRSYYYGTNRERQLQRGFNSSITSVYDDFNWRFLKSLRKEKDPDFIEKKRQLEEEALSKIDDKVIDKTITTLNTKLSQLGLETISISFFETNAPYNNAFLMQLKEHIEIPVSLMGSGVEMIISLLFLETLASLSKGKFIIIIDEPELHLHPKLQSKFIDYLINLSDTIQIIVNSHSPYFFMNCLSIQNVELITTVKENDSLTLTNTGAGKGLFPWSPSWGEINFRAYSLPTVEFHNELYGYIQESNNMWSEDNVERYFVERGINKSKQWTKVKNGNPQPPYDVTIMTYIRNTIHHPENTNNPNYTKQELHDSIEEMITLIESP